MTWEPEPHVFRNLEDFVAREKLAEDERWEDLRARRIDDLLADGEVVLGSITADHILVPTDCETPSKLRDGNWVHVLPPTRSGTFGQLFACVKQPARAEIEEASPNGQFVLAQRGSFPLPTGDVLIAPTPPMDSMAARITAIRDVAADAASPLRAALLNDTPAGTASVEPTDHEVASQTLYRELSAPGRLLRLVQGPPGCGKTTLIGELAPRLARDGASVLVVAFTNRAVDEAVRAMVKSGVPIHRLGRQQIASERGEVLEARTLAPTGGVLATTLHQVISAVGKGRAARFDIAIVDEGSQVTLPDLCAVAAVADRVALVGDHRQLPPVIVQMPSGAAAKDAFLTSAFEILCKRFPVLMLNRTHRMNRPLCEYVSRKYYGGLLESHDDIAGMTMPPVPAAPFGLDTEKGVLHVMFDPQEYSPDTEAGGVAAILVAFERYCSPWLREHDELTAEPDPASDQRRRVRYLVSCPHRAQVALVKHRLRLAGVPGHLWRVDTVERNQGQTASIALLSVGVPGIQAGTHTSDEWLLDDRRWNVALSRGRYRGVIASAAAFEDRVTSGAKDMVHTVRY